MSSPRRLGLRPVVLYELRMLRPIADLRKLLEFETSVSAWRGVEQWHVQVHRSTRGEVVVRIACERHVSPTQTVRLDNQWASWRRTIVGALRLEGVAIRRGVWIEVDGHSYRGDVQVMHETFEKAVEKLWQEVGHEEAVRCSNREPALPSTPPSLSKPWAQPSPHALPSPPSASATEPLVPRGRCEIERSHHQMPHVQKRDALAKITVVQRSLGAAMRAHAKASAAAAAHVLPPIKTHGDVLIGCGARKGSEESDQ